MATLKDLAKSLGLSVTTVSRALGGYPEVSEQTRARVREAAERLSYHPNPLAQKLVTGRSGLIGLITRGIIDTNKDTTFMQVALGISRELAVNDLELILRVGIEEDEIEPYRKMGSKQILDAFLINAPSPLDQRIAWLRDNKLPFVVHGRDHPRPDYPYYDLNNFKVAADAVAHLTELGHRRIALLNGPEFMEYAVERRRGFVESMAARGLSIRQGFILHGGLEETYGHRVTPQLMNLPVAERPTAIICASTAIAAGVLVAVRGLGLDVPRDVSIVAHDDGLPQSTLGHPVGGITVTRLAFQDACKPLAELIVGRLKGRPLVELQINAEAPLLVRRSTMAASGMLHG